MSTDTLEERFVEAIVASVNEIFESMIAMPSSGVEVLDAPNHVISADIIGSLGFTGSKSGLVVLAGSRELVTAMCAGMLMMDPAEVTDDGEIADSFGEITNMVAGNFKNAWVDAGNQMDLSIPSVSFGRDLALSSGRGASVSFSADFAFEHGMLRVELRMHD
jgi:chemotaxis protein CheX